MGTKARVRAVCSNGREITFERTAIEAIKLINSNHQPTVLKSEDVDWKFYIENLNEIPLTEIFKD